MMNYKKAKKGLEEDYSKNKVFINESDYINHFNCYLIRNAKKKF